MRPLVWTGVGLASAELLAPSPAGAHEIKPWMPRRHYRGLKEPRKAPEFEVLAPEQHSLVPCFQLPGDV